jgi:tetratricopeptide (TPR) repeat protein
VKGLAAPVEVYELSGIGAARTRLQAAARRGLTRFVGRDAEIELLRRSLGLAGAGHGQIVAIVGEAGVGKSRLVYEFTHSHRVQDWLVLEATSVSYGKATSYLPVIDLLRGYFKIQDRDDLREVREKVTGKVLALDESLRSGLSPLLALLDVPVGDPDWPALDPGQRRQRTLDAVKRLLLREAQEQPVLVIFEDLHWIDGETQAVLDSLVESLGSARMLLLVNYRPEYQHAWGSRTFYDQVRLDALPPERAADLLDALLGDDASVVPVKKLLVRRGNPFFLEESVRTLVETGALLGERGRFRLVQAVDTLQIPATVQAILAARIDRLSAEDKRLLQVASVIGKDVPLALLQAIADLPEETLHRVLARLQSAEFLYESRLFPDVEYSFKHALTHEVTYRGSLHERRRELHARIVRAIETLHRDRLGEHVEGLAHHAVHGELWPEAAAYLGQAGTKALERFAYRDAAASLEQAIAILATLPETREVLEQAVDLRLSLRRPMVLLAAAERGLALLEEAIRLAEKLGDTGRLGWAWAYRSSQLFTAFRRREAIAAAERALAAAVESGNEAVELLAATNLGVAAVELGDFSRAEESLTRVMRRTEVGHLWRFDRGSQPAVVSRGFLAVCFALRGRFRDAIACSDAAIRLADSAAEPNPLVLAHIHRGRVLSLQGEFGRAAETWQRGRLIAQEHDLAMQVPGLSALLGFACARGGRCDDASSMLREATSQLEPGKPAFLNVAIELGDGLAVLGRFEDALACGRAALEAGRERGERPLEAAALCLLGEIALLSESPEAVPSALQHYRAALDLATAFELWPLAAHCHLGLGKLYRRTDKREQAREYLATATTMYREMGMTYWLEKTETEMRELG